MRVRQVDNSSILGTFALPVLEALFVAIVFVVKAADCWISRDATRAAVFVDVCSLDTVAAEIWNICTRSGVY